MRPLVCFLPGALTGHASALREDTVQANANEAILARSNLRHLYRHPLLGACRGPTCRFAAAAVHPLANNPCHPERSEGTAFLFATRELPTNESWRKLAAEPAEPSGNRSAANPSTPWNSVRLHRRSLAGRRRSSHETSFDRHLSYRYFADHGGRG